MVAVPEPTEQALAYYFVRNIVWFANVAVSLAVPALFLFTGWSARIRDLAQRVSSRWAVVVVVYVVVFTVITWIIGLPLQYYEEFAVEHQFGLSNQTFAKWATDAVIGLVVMTIITSVVTLGIWRLLKRSPRRWWLYSGLAAIPFTIFMFLIGPIWISPLFNKFGPMQDKPLEAKILALADRAGIEGGRVFEVDKSVDTKTTNAYVTGVLDTKRIVLWDTIIKKLEERELLFVMAHEMGHYTLHHVWQFVVVVCGLIMLALYVAQRLCHGLIERYRSRFGFDRLEDIASFPLVTLVASGVLLVALPAFNAFSRHVEHEADRFALEITRDNEGGAKAFVSLQRDNLAIPRPNAFLHWLRGSHPTLADRIEFSNTYRPWEKGEPLRYGDRFKPQ